MTQSEKLQKVIDKVVENGWDKPDTKVEVIEYDCEVHGIGFNHHMFTVEEIIFSHQFAKAFWGEEYVLDGSGMVWDEYIERWLQDKEKDSRSKGDLIKTAQNDWKYWKKNGSAIHKWRYHIQKLALTPEDSRIDYLYQFIEQK